MRRDNFKPIAQDVYLDPANCDVITKENVQEAFEELCNVVQVVATPGFSFGRAGNAAKNSWLINNEVPSNLVGVPVGITSPIITEVWVGSENIDTYDYEIYEHEGDEINLTLLTTVSVVGTRNDSFTGLNIPVTTGRQIAVKIVNGNAKNPKAFILIKGAT